jgi:hypothetical protein
LFAGGEGVLSFQNDCHMILGASRPSAERQLVAQLRDLAEMRLRQLVKLFKVLSH